MKNKGQVNISNLLLIFIGAIVALSLIGAIALNTGISTTTYVHNDTLDGTSTTMPANGESADLTGQDLLSTPVVVNGTGSLEVAAGNYTIGERVSPTTGVKTVYIQTDSAEYANQPVNISYTYGPEGYATNSGARSVISLIVIFAALGIAIIALVPTLRSGVIEMMNR